MREFKRPDEAFSAATIYVRMQHSRFKKAINHRDS
jgi:hypothetical protein